MVIWWPMVKCSVSTKLAGQELFLRGRVVIHRRWQRCTAVHIEGSAKGSGQHRYVQLTPQTPLDGLHHVAQVAEQHAQHPEPVTQPSLVQSPIQNQQPLRSIHKWAEVVTHP